MIPAGAPHVGVGGKLGRRCESLDAAGGGALCCLSSLFCLYFFWFGFCCCGKAGASLPHPRHISSFRATHQPGGLSWAPKRQSVVRASRTPLLIPGSVARGTPRGVATRQDGTRVPHLFPLEQQRVCRHFCKGVFPGGLAPFKAWFASPFCPRVRILAVSD